MLRRIVSFSRSERLFVFDALEEDEVELALEWIQSIPAQSARIVIAVRSCLLLSFVKQFFSDSDKSGVVPTSSFSDAGYKSVWATIHGRTCLIVEIENDEIIFYSLGETQWFVGSMKTDDIPKFSDKEKKELLHGWWEIQGLHSQDAEFQALKDKGFYFDR